MRYIVGESAEGRGWSIWGVCEREKREMWKVRRRERNDDKIIVWRTYQ